MWVCFCVVSERVVVCVCVCVRMERLVACLRVMVLQKNKQTNPAMELKQPSSCHPERIVTELVGVGAQDGVVGGEREGGGRVPVIWTPTHRRFVKEPKCSCRILKCIASTLGRSQNSVKTKLIYKRRRRRRGRGRGTRGRSLLATCVTLYDVAANCL